MFLVQLMGASCLHLQFELHAFIFNSIFMLSSSIPEFCGPCDSDKAQVGTVLLKFENEPEVSIQDTKYEMVLEVIGNGKGNDKLGVDIVMVLDTRKSMRGEKLEAMKQAVRFVIEKLSASDRVSIITLARNSQKEWDFRPMTPDAKHEAFLLVEDLKAFGNANIGAGVRNALSVLSDRKLTTGRHTTIMLMSDGVQFDGGNANQVSVDRFPVFTFGFGAVAQQNQQVLKDIAEKSNGGKFYMVDRTNLFDVISKFLDWLLSKHIKDVKLVLKPLIGTVSRNEKITTKINKVYAGKYPQSTNAADGSVTVSFGCLGVKEKRKVLAELTLPAVTKEVHIDSLQLFCYYRDEKGNSIMKTNPLIFRVKRYTTPKVSPTYAKQVELAKHELVHEKSQVVKYGPYGSQLPENYRLVLEERERVKEVIIFHGFVVDAIGFVIEKLDGRTPTTKLFGGTVGDRSKIILKGGEYITKISGVYGNYMHQKNQCLIGKLWIHTSLCPMGHGPYGQATGIANQSSFSTPFPTKGPIVGFFGRHNNYLESVGIFVKQDC